VDTAEPQRKQPMEPWGNAGRSGPLARRVSHRVPRGRRTAGNRSRRHSTAWPSNLPGACGTEHFGELADPCGRDSQAVCLRNIVPMIDPSTVAIERSIADRKPGRRTKGDAQPAAGDSRPV
jgi:hypothetical protein